MSYFPLYPSPAYCPPTPTPTPYPYAYAYPYPYPYPYPTYPNPSTPIPNQPAELPRYSLRGSGTRLSVFRSTGYDLRAEGKGSTACAIL